MIIFDYNNVYVFLKGQTRRQILFIKCPYFAIPCQGKTCEKERLMWTFANHYSHIYISEKNILQKFCITSANMLPLQNHASTFSAVHNFISKIGSFALVTSSSSKQISGSMDRRKDWSKPGTFFFPELNIHLYVLL